MGPSPNSVSFLRTFGSWHVIQTSIELIKTRMNSSVYRTDLQDIKDCTSQCQMAPILTKWLETLLSTPPVICRKQCLIVPKPLSLNTSTQEFDPWRVLMLFPSVKPKWLSYIGHSMLSNNGYSGATVLWRRNLNKSLWFCDMLFSTKYVK